MNSGPPFGIRVEIGSYLFESEMVTIEVWDEAFEFSGNDQYLVFGKGIQTDGPPLPALLDVGPSLSWWLREAVDNPFSSTELLLDPPPLDAFSSNIFRIQLDSSRSGSPIPFVNIVGQVTSIVPEPSTLLDQFLCYKAKEKSGTQKFQPVSVTLEDQFGFAVGTVEQPEALCNPVDKNGEGINDPTAHLTCYKVTLDPGTPKLPEIVVETEDQFGQLTLQLGAKPKKSMKGNFVKGLPTLCVPSEKSGEPSNLNVDHFQLYEAKEKSGTPKFQPVLVDLEDQFGILLGVKVEKPERLGTPTDKNSEGILDEESHLTCYKVKRASRAPKLPKRVVEADDQFGHLTLDVGLKPKTLCVPSSKTVIE